MTEIRVIKFENAVIELHPKELALVLALRNKYGDGDVTITMRGGVPQYVKQVVVIDHLTGVTIGV